MRPSPFHKGSGDKASVAPPKLVPLETAGEVTADSAEVRFRSRWEETRAALHLLHQGGCGSQSTCLSQNSKEKPPMSVFLAEQEVDPAPQPAAAGRPSRRAAATNKSYIEVLESSDEAESAAGDAGSDFALSE